MPSKTKQTKAAPLTLPELGHDSTERKRVLNVLAQRRYRQRRKEHIRTLEAQAGYAEPSQDSCQQNIPPSPKPASPYFNMQYPADNRNGPSQCPFAAAHLYSVDNNQVLPKETELEAQPVTPPNDPFADILPEDQELWDTSILLPSLPSTPLSTSKHASSSESDTWSAAPLPIAGQSSKQWSATRQPPPFTTTDMTYSFPDEAYLEIAELRLLCGCMAIARRLDLQDTIWSLGATSPFTNPAMSLADFNHLPMNLKPTLLQLTMPHHPLIDLLPWPATRDRMIMVLSQPPDIRPPSAASPLALLEFVYDIEDSAEGIRISGSDPFSEHNWELGEKVFKSWWWVFDRDIIRRSNELRVSRGAPLLGGSILGEVA